MKASFRSQRRLGVLGAAALRDDPRGHSSRVKLGTVLRVDGSSLLSGSILVAGFYPGTSVWAQLLPAVSTAILVLQPTPSPHWPSGQVLDSGISQLVPRPRRHLCLGQVSLCGAGSGPQGAQQHPALHSPASSSPRAGTANLAPHSAWPGGALSSGGIAAGGLRQLHALRSCSPSPLSECHPMGVTH